MFWIGVLAVAIGLMISIALHEIGHLVPAKKFGVRVPQYFVGFGPTVWSRRRGETEYGIKAIPLGGFVRMIGMFPPGKAARSEDAAVEERLRRRGLRGWASSVAEDAREVSLEEIGPGDEGRAFYELSTPKKLVVMLGGPFVNLILSALLFTIVLSVIGVPALATSTVASVVPCTSSATGGECPAGVEDSPSAQAGFMEGDTIVSWGGAAVADWEDVSTAIREGGTDPVEVVVDRGGEQVSLTVTPALVDRPVYDESGAPVLDASGEQVTEEVPYVGLVSQLAREQQPLSTVPGVVGEQFVATAGVVLTLPQRLASIAESVFGDEERDPSVVGIIGVGRAAGDLTEAGADSGFLSQLSNLLVILASLNMALFVFNLIPLPPLDGGHVAGALYEGGRRQVAKWRSRPNPGYADTAKLMPLTYAMVLVFAGMAVLLAIADIFEPVQFV